MKFIKTFALLFVSAIVLRAQSLPPLPLTYVQNDTSTGTTLYKLVKLTGGNAVIAGTSDTSGIIGVCVGNCGTSGTATIAYAGTWPVIVDGTTTAGRYLKISSSVAGDGADSGASTYPTSGQVLGRIVTASTGAASKSQVLLMLGTEAQASTTGTVDPLVLSEAAAPSGQSGKAVLYTKTDHKVYGKLNNGSEDQLCTVATGGCGSGSPITTGQFTPPNYSMFDAITALDTYTANNVWVYEFDVPHDITIDHLGVFVAVASGTCGGTCGARIAIWNLAGTSRECDSGAITSGGTPDLNASNTGLDLACTGGEVTLTAGAHLLAATTDSTALKFLVPTVGAYNIGVFPWRANNFPTSTARSGKGTSGSGSGGSINFSSTIGTITADNDNQLAPVFVLTNQ